MALLCALFASPWTSTCLALVLNSYPGPECRLRSNGTSTNMKTKSRQGALLWHARVHLWQRNESWRPTSKATAQAVAEGACTLEGAGMDSRLNLTLSASAS